MQVAAPQDDNLQQQENIQVAAPQVANNQVPTGFCYQLSWLS